MCECLQECGLQERGFGFRVLISLYVTPSEVLLALITLYIFLYTGRRVCARRTQNNGKGYPTRRSKRLRTHITENAKKAGEKFDAWISKEIQGAKVAHESAKKFDVECPYFLGLDTKCGEDGTANYVQIAGPFSHSVSGP